MHQEWTDFHSWFILESMTQKTQLILATVLAALASLGTYYYFNAESAPNTSTSEHTKENPQSESPELEVGSEAFNKDIARIEAVIASKNPVQDKVAWAELKDFTKPIDEIVTESNSKALRDQVKAKAPAIMECLKRDLCGMTKDGPEDTYFDDLHTPGHALLERLFEANFELQQLNGEGALSDEELLEAFSDTNETIQTLALETYLAPGATPAKVSEVLARESTFSGDGAAKLYQILLGTGGLADDTRADVIDKLSRKLLEADPFTHVAIAESLQQLNLSPSEAEQLMPALCRFSADNDNIQNWYVVRHHMKAIGLSPEQCGSY